MVYRTPGREMDKELKIQLSARELVMLAYKASPQMFESFKPDDVSCTRVVEKKTSVQMCLLTDHIVVEVHLLREDLGVFEGTKRVKPTEIPPPGVKHSIG